MQTEIASLAGKLYNALSDRKKQKYINLSKEETVAYKTKMEEFM